MSVQPMEAGELRVALAKQQMALEEKAEEREKKAYDMGHRDGIRDAQPFGSFFLGGFAGVLVGAFTNWGAVAGFVRNIL